MSNSKYSEINKCFEELDDGTLEAYKLYNHRMVNWSGPRGNNKTFYTEFIAEQLLKRKDLFSKINKSGRNDYFVPGHDGVTNNHSNRTEEIFAKSLLGHQLEHLGTIIGYQMPLKATQADDYGKVDLISFKDNTAFLIELKMADKKETLLRAALEAETYHQLVDKKVFQRFVEEKVKDRFGEKDIEMLEIKKAVLFATNKLGKPKELKAGNADNYKNLYKLLEDLEIGVFTINHTYPVENHFIS
ncbi:MAG TPA: hypothetical protein VF181_01020 [Balneolaceae bacterium]